MHSMAKGTFEGEEFATGCRRQNGANHPIAYTVQKKKSSVLYNFLGDLKGIFLAKSDAAVCILLASHNFPQCSHLSTEPQPNAQWNFLHCSSALREKSHHALQ